MPARRAVGRALAVWPWAAKSRRAAGLALRTRPTRSTTSTPSLICSITSLLSCACWRASSMLPLALRSSRARRGRELAGQYRNRKQAKTSQAGLGEQQSGGAACAFVLQPGRPQNGQGIGGSNAQRHQPGSRTDAIKTGKISNACELKLAPAR